MTGRPVTEAVIATRSIRKPFLRLPRPVEIRSAAFCALAFLVSVSQATPVTIKVGVNVDSYFDYPTQTNLNMSPVSGVVSFTFDIDQIVVTDFGSTTIARFGDVLGAVWTSPLTGLIPQDPASGAYGNFYNSYVFPNVSDYPDVFIEEAAAQANTFASDGVNQAAYHIEVRATRRSPPRAGDGTSDYAFDKSSLLSFYREFVVSGEEVSFNESYQLYRFLDGSPLYSEGRSWSDFSARILEVVDHAASVPEPSSALLLVPGFIALALRRRGRSDAKLSSREPSLRSSVSITGPSSGRATL